MQKSKQIMRFVLFLSFIVSVTVQPVVSNAATIWDKRKKAVEDITAPAKELQETIDESAAEPIIEIEEELSTASLTDSIDPSEIIIPEQYGTIIETHNGTNGKLIVHIQDAHCNYEGQMNCAKIIESLIEDYDLNLILGEGHSNDEDYKYFRVRASLEDRKEAADSLVKEGYFTGINYLDLATDYWTKVRGIEDRGLYEAHRVSLWEIDAFKELASEYIDKLISVSDTIKPKIYNEDLLELDSKKKDYDADKIELLEYYEYLYSKAEENEFPLYTFPNFQSLIRASELEKKIDLVKIRDGSASEEEMDLYSEYIEATRNLNINDLFKEEPMLEDTVQDILAVNSDQKKMIRISKALAILKNLLRIKVVPEEYKYFVENKKDFDPQLWTGFLAEKAQGLGLSVALPDNYYIISDNLPKIEEFYSMAAEREKVFLEKTNKHMADENVNLAVLVAGGFHTPTLMSLLADAGYSYIVISPKVTTETDDELYRWALKLR